MSVSSCSILRFTPPRSVSAAPTLRLETRQPEGTWRTTWSRPAHDIETAGDLGRAMRLISEAAHRLPPSWPQDWRLSIPPLGDNGFAIEITRTAGSVCGWFGGLEEQFVCVDHALAWVARALSGEYELRTVVVGDRACEWRLRPAAGSGGSDLELACGETIAHWPWRSALVSHRRNRPQWADAGRIVGERISEHT